MFRYNFSPIASAPMAGRNHSEETKMKISDSHKGKTILDETKELMSEAIKGKYKGENHPMYCGSYC
jgi:hypothetical protein